MKRNQLKDADHRRLTELVLAEWDSYVEREKPSCAQAAAHYAPMLGLYLTESNMERVATTLEREWPRQRGGMSNSNNGNHNCNCGRCDGQLGTVDQEIVTQLMKMVAEHNHLINALLRSHLDLIDSLGGLTVDPSLRLYVERGKDENK